jgi:hypothetical protein
LRSPESDETLKAYENASRITREGIPFDPPVCTVGDGRGKIGLFDYVRN